MLQTKTPVLRRFWYPVIPLAHLADGPKPFTLLDENIVLWLDGEGRPSALADRCCHRTAKLSKGFYTSGRLACGYHGWEFDKDGRVMRVPQRPVDRQGATNMRVPAYHCQARYGYVWVALEDPLFDIPVFEEEAEGCRRIDEFYEPWNCAGLRLMENSFDNAHFSFVHRASFGDQGHPEPARLEIETYDDGFLFITEVPVRNPEIQKKVLNMESDTTVRHMRGRWYMPFMRKLRIRYPNGLSHSIVTAATPMTDDTIMTVQFVFRNDTEEQAKAADVIAFDRLVTNEDRDILEATDFDVPLDQTGVEMNMPSDKPGVLMRKMLLKLLADHAPKPAVPAEAAE
jgi:phenylpropionate dioxygenase-like ring-hydroxylating dioxygenase large terminal subunit